MAQTSSSIPGLHGHGYHGNHGHGHSKITKPRSRPAVKPILKKLQSHHSHSEKNSLDLDRSWDEQGQFGYGYSSYNVDGDDSSYTAGASALPTPAARARDVSFSISATDISTGGARPNKYSHARSTSGTSHASHASIATSASGGRNGSFVHPFQQTPRTSTPPLSYANSLASLDNPSGPRDCSPTITETEDDFDPPSLQTSSRTYHSGPGPRRPSLASQRTSSLSDVNQPLRMTSHGRSNSGISARKPHSIVTRSRSDLHLNTDSTTALDSASSASPPSSFFISPQILAASTSSNAMSPLRSSLDMSGFRLRSRSEVDTVTRKENVREARRKFEEKEKAKEEKYHRKQERAEAHRLNKNGCKGSFGTSRISTDRMSSSTDIRPTISSKTIGNGVGLGLTTENEKVDFATRSYDTAPLGQSLGARTDDVHFQPTQRTNTAKRRTTSAWTAFVLWLRTRLLKLGRR
ncbi:hypothetical protein FHETE_313 [Fusarium heterosporum]|uniref:Uncharacterized protein n=1 Tax=Fusarium heterosporum TaxID=42747 RepID=A0A8H5U4B5_FUSHE|nr:hypothetical protein FHETE_313 [Fusarium heterosporum]